MAKGLKASRRRRGLRKLLPEVIAQAQDQTAATIARIMLTFVGLVLFCLLSLLTPDAALLSPATGVPGRPPLSHIPGRARASSCCPRLRIFAPQAAFSAAVRFRVTRGNGAARIPGVSGAVPGVGMSRSIPRAQASEQVADPFSNGPRHHAQRFTPPPFAARKGQVVIAQPMRGSVAATPAPVCRSPRAPTLKPPPLASSSPARRNAKERRHVRRRLASWYSTS